MAQDGKSGGGKMIFKGLKFRRSRTVVVIPEEHNTHMGHLSFGKVCQEDVPGAVLTNYINSSTKQKVYAKPIPLSGHSLTNMAYGEKKTLKHPGGWSETHVMVYLCVDGKTYTHKKYL
jgi:hypothetical protein